MKASTEIINLSDLLYSACLEYIDAIVENITDETVYAFVIFCYSGCEGMLPTIATHESLTRLNQGEKISGYEQYDSFNSVNVAEWEYVGLYDEMMNPLNDRIREKNEKFYLIDFEDGVDLSELLTEEIAKYQNQFDIEILVRAINKLKKSGCLNRPGFDKNLLLGAFFSDPGENGIYVMEHVSAQVNSPDWHQQIKTYIDFLKG